MISYIYPFRNRDLKRIKRSLDSLVLQDDTDFEVIFVDTGSNFDLATQVKALVTSYTFVRYIYTYTEGTPWNKSNALNIGIKQATTPYIITADIDMIFHSRFNNLAKSLAQPKQATFFKVAYLSENETYTTPHFKPESYSNHRGTGICLYPKTEAETLRGFDEFYHCWGGEDEDFVTRLELNGCKVSFHEELDLIFHQYHTPYKAQDDQVLTQDLKYQFVRYYNDAKRKHTLKTQQTVVNTSGDWGGRVSEATYKALRNIPITRTLTSFRPEIDFFLNYELAALPSGNYGFKFTPLAEPSRKISLKYILYRIVRLKFKDEKIRRNYTLKAMNDCILKTIIYRDIPYHYQVNTNAQHLELRIHKA